MCDFWSTMPPDLLVEQVQRRQAELRDEVRRASRRAARMTDERNPAPIARIVRRLRGAVAAVAA